MNVNTDGSILDRGYSGFPLAIGTGMAFEALFDPLSVPIDPDRQVPRQDLSVIDEVYINLWTLMRNIASASNPRAVMISSDREWWVMLSNEMSVINDLFASATNGRIKPRFYFNTYDSLTKGKVSKYILTRPVSNSKVDNRLEAAASTLIKYLRQAKLENIEVGDWEIKPHGVKPRGLILSHAAVDLLSYRNFLSLTLLESHTAKLKTRMEWNSKYYPIPGADMSILPWQPMLLWLFGDKTIIKPHDMKVRKLVMDMAVEKHWTAATTEMKIRHDIREYIKEPAARDILLSLPN